MLGNTEKITNRYWDKFESLHYRYEKKSKNIDILFSYLKKINEVMKNTKDEINKLNKNFEKIQIENPSLKIIAGLIKETVKNQVNFLSNYMKFFEESKITVLKSKLESDIKDEKKSFKELKDTLENYESSKNKIISSKANTFDSLKNIEKNIKKKNEEKENFENKGSFFGGFKDKFIYIIANQYYDSYYSEIKKANQMRDEIFRKQNISLILYRGLENNDKVYLKSIKDGLIKLEKEQKALLEKQNINEVQDKLMKDNKEESEKKINKLFKFQIFVEPEIKIEQYIPKTAFEACENFDEFIKLCQSIQELKNVVEMPGIFPEFNIEVEKKKQRTRELSEKFFDKTLNEDEKNEFLNLLQKKENQGSFLIILTKQRTGGRFCRPQELIIELGKIMNLVLETAETDNDYNRARNCIILSDTFYFEKNENENKTKVYLSEYICGNKWIRNPKFWKGLIEETTKIEIKKLIDFESIDVEIFLKSADEGTLKKIGEICTNIIPSYVLNMKNYYIDFRFIIKMTGEYSTKYNINPTMTKNVYDLLSLSDEEIANIKKEISENKNLENELLSFEEMKKKMKK